MTTITLDRRAMHALIDSDPDFTLSLKGAVLTEIARKFFEKDVRRIIAAAEPEMFAKALAALQKDADVAELVRRALTQAVIERPSGPWSNNTLTAEMRDAVAREVARVQDAAAAKAVADVGRQIEARVLARLAELNTDERIEKRVERLTEDHINKRVDERFRQRLADLQKGS